MSVLGGLIGFAGGVANNLFQSDAASKQREENEKNRQHNLMLAQMQNQWNVDQWNRENAYNNPSAVRQRLKAAGLNPDLMYSNGAGSMSAAQSPAMSAGQGSNPSDVSALANRSSALMQAAAIQQMQAQTRNINANTAKTNSETTGQDISNKYAAMFSENGLELQNFQMKLTGSQLDLNRKQMSVLDSQISNIDANTAKMTEELSLIQSQIDVNVSNERYMNSMRRRVDTLVDYEAKNLAAQTSLSYAEARSVLELLPEQLNLTRQQGKETRERGIGESIQNRLRVLGIDNLQLVNGQLRVNLKSDMTYKDLERAVGIVESISQSVANMTSSISKFAQ